MKAVILAAGKGERLGEVARSLPKPLVAIEGKPIIVHLIELCRRHGIRDILINLHHLPEVICARLGDGARWDVSISYKLEPALLGTGGAVRNFRAELGTQTFFVLYGDNCADYDLSDLLRRHAAARAELTLAAFQLEDTRQSGVLEADTDGRVRSFAEKPPGPPRPGLVNAGIYVMEPALAADIPEGPCDFGKDLLPRWIEQGRRVHAAVMDHGVRAVDTPELYGRWTRGQEGPR